MGYSIILFVDLPGPFSYLRSVISLRISIGFGVAGGLSVGCCRVSLATGTRFSLGVDGIARGRGHDRGAATGYREGSDG